MAVERHWIIEETFKLKQLVYFKDVLSSQWKPGDMLHWGSSLALFSPQEKKSYRYHEN